MRKFFFFLMSFAAMSVLFSCEPAGILEGSYTAKLYQVDEMFNGEVAQSIAITTDGPFKENGVTWLQQYVRFIAEERWDESSKKRIVKYYVPKLPIGDNKASCNLLREELGYSVFECYFFTDNTKKESCEWFDNFMWIDIYQDKAGYLYRFGEDGTAVELSRTKNSKGQWIYWDCLRAHYVKDSKIGPTYN
ncbi:MAG: hypothetical protein E7125_06230 [Bacteroidales bacterium]|jgi:hypothetical protein|nr:hypothetical protein [Bacteroidales bacterium]